MHLQLLPDTTTAIVPANTPFFSFHPIMARGKGTSNSKMPELSRELTLMLVDFPLLRAKNFLKHGGQILE
jgi:hypothetical protein